MANAEIVKSEMTPWEHDVEPVVDTDDAYVLIRITNLKGFVEYLNNGEEGAEFDLELTVDVEDNGVENADDAIRKIVAGVADSI